jgi:hypothetical protein
MPSLRQSLVELDPKRYQRVDPRAPIAHPEPFRPSPAPEPPIGIRRSPVMISSLPLISTNVDGIMRQFYGGGNFPTRRLVSP